MIDEIFDSNFERKTDLLRALLTAGVSLHEAGHLLMAEKYDLPVNFINLPRFDSYFGPNRTTEDDQDTTASIGIKNKAYELEQIVAFYLGGLYGELSIYNDSDLSDHRQSLYAMTYGLSGDIRSIIRRITQSTNASAPLRTLSRQLNQNLTATNGAGECSIFLNNLDYDNMPFFQEFRDNRPRHRLLASRLMEKWRAVNFQRYHTTDASSLLAPG